MRTVFTVPKNVKFVHGNLRACPLGTIQGRPTSVARSQCRKSIVGKGIVEANYGAIRGEVLLIAGGKRTMYVHTDLAGGALIIVIEGRITRRRLIFTGILPPPRGASSGRGSRAFRPWIRQIREGRPRGRPSSLFGG